MLKTADQLVNFKVFFIITVTYFLSAHQLSPFFSMYSLQYSDG